MTQGADKSKIRAFGQLTVSEQKQAKAVAMNLLLSAIVERQIRFDDRANGDNLQAKIDDALHRAEENKTPWFAHTFVLDVCQEEIENMSVCAAEDAMYPDEGVQVINLAHRPAGDDDNANRS